MNNLESKDLWNGERLETNVFNEVAVEHLHRYAIALSLVKGKEVLDLASGEGYGTNLLATVANQVTGVDIAKEVIQHAKTKYNRENLRFLEGSAENIPVKSNSVDVVVSFETIEHHNKHEEMLSEIKRVLKKNGLLIISSPDKLNYSDKTGQINPYHVKELYTNEFKELIGKYFNNLEMFYQKNIYCSLIVPQDGIDGFEEYSGFHDCIYSFPEIQNPTYNLCIASDIELKYINASVFDGKGALERLISIKEKQIEESIKESRTYKIGFFFTKPIKQIFYWLKTSDKNSNQAN
jgi:ubiquinone/menaquinone biosynthesis C-methylase UbiE